MKRLILLSFILNIAVTALFTLSYGQTTEELFGNLTISGGNSLRITDSTGADSLRIFDDGDTTRFESDNPIKIGNGSMIIAVDGSVSASGKMLHGLGAISANTRNEFSNFVNDLGLLIKPNAAGTADRFEIQDENSNTEFIVKDGGSVGIGTSTPSEKLEVVGSITSTVSVSSGKLTADNLNLDGNLFSSSTGDIDVTTQTGGVFKFVDNAFQSGQDASNYLEIGHGGSNAFVNSVGAGNMDFRFGGVNKASFTPSGHLHLKTDTDQKHNLKIITANNANASGIAWENSGGNFSQTIFRADVGSNRSDLVFAIGSDANIDLLTNSFLIHGSSAEEGKLEVVGDFQITSGNPGANKVLTSDASGNATWVLASGGGWTDGGTDIFLTTVTDKVGIGEAGPDTKLHVSGGSAGTITPAVGTMATLENSANTYLSILSPDANERGIFFGEPSSSLAGAIIYNNSTTLDGLQFRTNGNNTRMVIASNGRVGIGTEAPNAIFDVHGNPGTSVGGFPSGHMHVTGTGTGTNSNSVITFHTLFNGNTQNAYVGNTSSSNNNFGIINRRDAEVHIHTNNIKYWTMEADGDIVLEQQLQIKGGSPGVDKVLTSDANGLATWETISDIHIGGNFVDTIDQSITTVSVGQAVRFTKTTLIDDITHTTDSTFTINTSGVYDLIIAPQLAQGSGAATVEFWIEKNGVNIAQSNVQETIAANSQSLPLLRWKEKFVATDVFKIIWASNSVNSMLDNITSTYGGPNIPSIMMGITFTHD